MKLEKINIIHNSKTRMLYVGVSMVLIYCNRVKSHVQNLIPELL